MTLDTIRKHGGSRFQMTATGFLPPRCGAVVGRGVIPSSCSPGPAPALLFFLADQTIRPAPLTGGICRIGGGRWNACIRQGPKKTSPGSIGSRKKQIRSTDGAAPIANGGEYQFTSSTSVDPSGAGENWFNMLPPTFPRAPRKQPRGYTNSPVRHSGLIR